ncbi:MAG: hypothetical protein HY560_14220 [Gemmatimonadetes bacterium]|nr:hypothetical protein [Gemmatimonadota bacterium]
MARTLTWALVAASTPALSWAQGHGPAFGLSTPTLGKHGWSLDLAVMGRAAGGKAVAMTRPMLSYGVTQDLQLSLSLPMRLYVPEGVPPVHGMSRMPMSPDVELLLGWRFHRRGTAVGSRVESTAYVGFDYPTDAVRAGVRMAPGLYGALVGGYASRSWYAWLGGLYRRYMTPVGPTADHPGDVAMYSAVLGLRPPPFRHDYPRPDWRVFLEAFGERTARDVIGGVERTNTGSHRIFVGPTLLGLYGAWGVAGGVVFPVYQKVNGAQPEDRLRLIVNTTFWF